MTANAFMSGSLSPPFCIISVATGARMHALLREGGNFGVSILARGQEDVSAHFAGRPVPDLVPVFTYVGLTPVLAEAAATIAADVVARHDCGDHSIFIGHIFHMGTRGYAPLVVHDGRYASLMYADEPSWAPVTDFW